MKRIFVLALLAVAIVAGSALAQTFPGPSSPDMARIYFYRTADIATQGPVRWTGVFIDGQKVGDLGESSFFYRDVAPGARRISVSSDQPHPDQFQNISVVPNSTTFVRVFNVPGWGAQVFTSNGFSQLVWPSVFGNRVIAPAIAQSQMLGLSAVR